jgi:hypothetical protein
MSPAAHGERVRAGTDRRAPKRSKTKVILFWVGGVFGVLLVSCMACGIYFEASKKGALAYNDKMALGQRRVAVSRDRFLGSVATALNFGNFGADNMRQIRTEYQQFLDTLNAVWMEMPSWDPPSSARKLHDKFDEYMRGEQESAQKFGRALAILENGNMSVEQKRNQCDRIMKEAEDSEKASFAELQKLQRELASSHGFMLR